MNNLKLGDILVFKAGNDWVGKTIAWLTDSDVSHAAVMISEGKMVEMGANGIHVGGITATDGNNVILLRMSQEKDAAPILSAAKKYIDSGTRYDFPALVFLAGLIIYRRIRPTKKLVIITDVLLRAACSALDKLIQKLILKNPNKAMVCSQLVYQVYEDCGKDYHIDIQGGILQDAAVNTDDGAIRLVDFAVGALETDLGLVPESDLPEDEEIAKELYAALTELESTEEAQQDSQNLGALPAWCSRFLERLEEFLEKSKSNIPLDALFVTPADLAYNTKNLTRIGELNITRIQ